MPLPDPVAQLIENFAKNRSDYHKGHYNETQTRIDYVNPLFAALGWDMDNAAGLSELHREVIHEDKIKIAGRTKAPDYSFRTGGDRKFFLETKKPIVTLDLEQSPAYQIRRYGWTAKLPLSILTNFEEFAVYDTRVAPEQKDSARSARLEYFKFGDYAEKWDSLKARFSRDAVFSGAFDRYAEESRAKRIAVPVDKAFLAEISGWREKLARNIVHLNPDLGPRELNYAVQMIIDRLIFLRISEDRGAEPDFLLQPLLNKGGPVYPRLLDVFHRADSRYNSGLFHFGHDPHREAPDDVTPHLKIDDRTLKEIIASVYYPESPFEFSVFPADILGQVYEQFLGKVIRISGHTAEVEDKPEVKKAGGVYYTPTYIVDYIVRNTVGKLVDGKTPAQVSKLTILDPACGSGSFLIGAYQFLLDWHLRYYLENGKEKWARGKATIYLFRKDPALGEIWRLTTAEKKRILLNNIYGVDIDTQAVEVSKLSLLLKVLEGESAQLIDNTLSLYQERALPDLEHNIKCGNSLIGPDFYADKDMALFDLEAQLKINTFDWTKAFPKIMASGGFDAVIGNPPYVQLSMADYFDDSINSYLTKKYSSSMGRLNTYALFTAKSLTDLQSNKGLLGFIIPNTILTQDYYQSLRQEILKNEIQSLTSFQYPVFSNAVVETTIIIVKRSAPRDNNVLLVDFDNKTFATKTRDITQNLYVDSYHNAFLVRANSDDLVIKDKIDKAGVSLSSLTNINQAIALKHDRSKSLFQEQAAENYKPVIDGRNINRFQLNWSGYYLAYDVNNIHSCKRKDIFEAEKIFFRRVGDRLIATYDDQKFYALNTLVVITPNATSDLKLRYLLGLINSKLLNFYYVTFLKSTKTVFSEIQARQLGQLPIYAIDFAKPAEKAKHDKMVQLVERMLTLHKDKAAARLTTEKNMLQTQIEATDTQIDKLVYDLYGLTEAEIAVVEGTAG